MIRSVIVGVIVTYLLAVFQVTVGAKLAIGGISPDLLLVWTVCLGLLSGSSVGALTGFGGGLLEGALHQTMLGILAIGKAVSGYGAGYIAAKTFRENWLVPVLSAALLTVINETLLFLFSPSGSNISFVRSLLGRALYHALLAPFFFSLIARARQALIGQQIEAG